MIIKEKDARYTEIKELEALLTLDLPPEKAFLIERELKSLKQGDANELNSAYFIDFYYRNSKNHAIIHDLRLELDGLSAQIDHLIINRFFDIIILESKSYLNGIRILDTGEFEAYYRDRYIGIESPIEQNKRHQHLLNQILKTQDIMPKRLGITISPKFYSYVLISPKSRIIRPKDSKFDSSVVLKADMLKTELEQMFKNENAVSVLTSIGKMSSTETLTQIATALASCHTPKIYDYRKRFDINVAGTTSSATKTKNTDTDTEATDVGAERTYFCFKCHNKISLVVAKFCWNNREKYGGKAYCMDCQKKL